MITTSLSYISSLLLLCSVIVLISDKSKSKLFEYFPAIVIIYFVIVLLSACGFWDTKSTEIIQTRSQLQDLILPIMLFLMLIRCDIRMVIKLGRKLLIAFFGASISIIIAFVIMHLTIGRYISPDAWKGFSALSASWMGGTGNMVAVKQALATPDNQMGYILLTDSISYTIWFAFLFALISRANIFDKWTKAGCIEEHIRNVNIDDPYHLKGEINFVGIFLLIAIAFTATDIATILSNYLPVTELISAKTWTILLVTLFGFLGAMTPIAKIRSDSIIASIFLYFLVALIASGSSFKGFSEAPIYIVCGLMVLVIHAILMVIIAKIFRLNLAMCSIASLANIGGIAGAPILASAYTRSLVSIAVVMALLGFLVGTQGGLIVAKILSGFAL
ncbi:DUF819 family protein [Francisella tularensis subsp. novicida]|uniref:DUF819 family protein n=1 Tax=Francisella tularensis TaxID=263 RepID=UPI000158B018|nr:DUF819 family protein [Francisella tularensis]AJI45951.1 hypothetical protein AS84_1843 [Francisella tularensis subsp. novicida F6168]AJJ46786.1 hypothetical protein CH70_1348 [Francisella tularensis subsp. novicida]APC98392.1 hypothetical protein KX03_717 [Francisella tularensis subsp. novicida]EDN36049.1 conserved hypothetical protein [Francisella tularensis subsp. novicida GA99-3549]KFJ68858.1 hypothetical protein DR83_1388 [Francisella tularensis subsp. novicida]